MKLLFHRWLLLGLLPLAACERVEKNEVPADGSMPEDSRPQRPPRETSPDSREALRSALAEAEALADPRARDKALAEVAWNALERDVEIAREAFDRLAPDSPQRIALIQHFAMRLADENPDIALEWAGSLASESETAAAQARIALVIAPADPARAANLLSESGLASREFDVAIVQVLRHWASHSPPDAAAWVAVFPEGGFRKAGVETVISQWTASDPQAAISWLSKLGDEGLRAEATVALAKAWSQQSPETRDTWLQAVDARTRTALEALPDRE